MEDNPLLQHRLDSQYLRLAYNRLFRPAPWLTVKRRLGLSDRELQVGLMMAKGLDLEAIAQKLSIQIGTVRTHRKNLMRRLGVSGKVQAVVKMILATGLLTEEEEIDIFQRKDPL